VPTEWETVWLISPYNCYQNTISSSCFNQSFHSQAPRKPLKQNRPAPQVLGGAGGAPAGDRAPASDGGGQAPDQPPQGQ